MGNPPTLTIDQYLSHRLQTATKGGKRKGGSQRQAYLFRVGNCVTRVRVPGAAQCCRTLQAFHFSRDRRGKFPNTALVSRSHPNQLKKIYICPMLVVQTNLSTSVDCNSLICEQQVFDRDSKSSAPIRLMKISLISPTLRVDI